jgi:hypothetical protein
MKTIIHEIGVIDKVGNKHPVYFKTGLNVVTGKSSTGKSALIEIFDYCFASSENTIPKGVITKNAVIYYVCLKVNEQNMVIARNPKLENKGFFKREDNYTPNMVHANYFDSIHFLDLDRYKKHLTSLFIDIDDVDTSLEAKKYRYNNAKSATPSIRSFTSFMLQHQNLVANKHALFYRFDEKAKRDQVIEHTKIFLGLVNQSFFLLSQENEKILTELNLLKKERENVRRLAGIQSQRLEPVLSELYAFMGVQVTDQPISIKAILGNPIDAKVILNKFIIPEKISHGSDASIILYDKLKKELGDKTAELRSLHRKSTSIKNHISEEIRFVNKSRKIEVHESIFVSDTICPFCNTQKEELAHSAKNLQLAIDKISDNLASTRPIKAKFESQLMSVKQEILRVGEEVNTLTFQIRDIERSEKIIAEQKSLYEAIIMRKAQLFSMLDGINLADDAKLELDITNLEKALESNINKLKEYNVKDGLENASKKVNEYMAEIGQNFEFEESYRPIKLHFSFETFDLYHQAENEKIYLRSMGSGANWMYCHVTLFLALHRYFSELEDKCSIPTVLFLDQPTQVYFPNFKRDYSESFDAAKQIEEKQRSENERPVDDDIKAVQNLFSQLSKYCLSLEKALGYSPQIIVTDHADELTLSDNISFESLVNGNRWRARGFIDPIPGPTDESPLLV